MADPSVCRALLLLLVATGIGCQLVIGTEDRPVDPVLDGCTLPTAGGARIRFANLVATDAAVDVCVRPLGGEYARPVLRGGGRKCPSGFSYPQVSAPFSVPEGRIDVKVVSAGSTCTGAAAAELHDIAAPRGSITSIVHLGGKPSSLRAFRDASERPGSDAVHVRFMHASAGTGALDFGFATSPGLPANLSSRLLDKPLAFGEATNSQTTAILRSADANGYLDLPRTEVNLVATRAGESRALMATTLSTSNSWQTFIAIGDPTSPLFPVRGLLCDELDVKGLFTTCRPSALSTLSVDVFNAALYGAASQEESARRLKVMEAISTHDSDLMCLAQFSQRKDRDAVIAAARATGKFPFSVTSETDLSTAATDPRDWDGKTPVPRAHPSCGGGNDGKQVEAALACITDNCTGPDGKVSSTSCLSSKCVAEMVALLVGNADAQRCYSCIAVAAGTDETLSDVRALCTADVRDYKGFRGQAASVILSRLPIRSSETFVLPATSYQRVVQYAEVELEAGKFIDYYCTNFTSPYGDLLAYSGFYGGDATGAAAWNREAQLQAMRTIEFIKRKSDGRRAVVSGDWSASREHKSSDGTVVIANSNPRVLELLDEALVPAFPEKWEPACTECGSPLNPYNTSQSTWAARTYLFGMSRTSALEVSVFFKDPVVALSTGAMGPLSHSFGFNARILRPD